MGSCSLTHKISNITALPWNHFTVTSLDVFHNFISTLQEIFVRARAVAVQTDPVYRRKLIGTLLRIEIISPFFLAVHNNNNKWNSH